MLLSRGKLSASPTSSRTRLFAQAFAELSARVLAIQFCDETGAYLGGTNCFTFVGICAIAESFGIHHAYHFQNATFSFRIALRQKCKVRDFRGSEEHS